MRIAFDQQIFLGEAALEGLGDLMPLAEDQITKEVLVNVDALVVRSVTRVDRALLEGTRIAFVGSVTAGIDHVDAAHLAGRGVRFVHAPGCNARSVATYVAAAVLGLAAQGRLRLGRLGVVGRGEVGGRVARWASALGLQVVACDPPRERTGERDLHDLDSALDCDVVTLHVPLTLEGPEATHALLDEGRLARMRRGSWLIHTCRGGIVDEPSLAAALAGGHLAGAVIDVWADEPSWCLNLAAQAEIATPHIAGHSLEGKANGTWMVRAGLASWLRERGIYAPPLPARAKLPPANPLVLPPGLDRLTMLDKVLRGTCDPWADARAFRDAADTGVSPAQAFIQARRAYAPRRDPEALGVREAGAWEPLLEAFGYAVS